MIEKEVALKVKNAGGRLYLVGGALRDELMGFFPKDKDYCVTGMTAKEFQELFPDAQIIGKDFPVFMLYGKEFALARKDRKVSQGYKGFEIETSKDISIVEDLKRRDITINAIAKDVLTEEIIDPYDGIKDINSKIIRHIYKNFSEDPLRVYRVARFAARFNFTVDKETIKLMNSLKEELKTITIERVYVELKKALSTNTPSVFFKVLRQANVLDVHFKEIYDLIGVIQPEKYHPEGEVFNHTMIVLDEVASKTEYVEIRFAALTHDLGKAMTPENVLPQHIDHDKVGVDVVREMCNRLKLPTRWKKIAMEVCKYHMKIGTIENMRPYKQAIYLDAINRSLVGIENMKIIVDADDMLDRTNSKIVELSKYVYSRFTADNLIEKGILPQEIGIEKFKHKLYEEQAKLIKEYYKKII